MYSLKGGDLAHPIVETNCWCPCQSPQTHRGTPLHPNHCPEWCSPRPSKLSWRRVSHQESAPSSSAQCPSGDEIQVHVHSENNIVIIITDEKMFTYHCTNILVLCNLVFTILQIKSKCHYSNTLPPSGLVGEASGCALWVVCVCCCSHHPSHSPDVLFLCLTNNLERSLSVLVCDTCDIQQNLCLCQSSLSFFCPCQPFPLESEDWLYPLEFP